MTEKKEDQTNQQKPKEDAETQPSSGEGNNKKIAPPVKAILGRKVGMTSLFSAAGESVPVTVLEAGSCSIVQVKSVEKQGYSALQLGFGEAKEKNVGKPLRGHFKKAGVPGQALGTKIKIIK